MSLLDKVEKPVIPYYVLQELDKIKLDDKSDRGLKARQAVRKLKSLDNKVEYVLRPKKFNLFEFIKAIFKPKSWLKPLNNDDLIVQIAKKYNCTLISGDFLVLLKAKALGIPFLDIYELQDDLHYTGYIEVSLSEPDMAYLYENRNKNIYNLKTNQYLIIRDTNNEVKDALKWDGHFHQDIEKGNFKSLAIGSFAPKDIYQKLVVDSLKRNKVTMIKGKAGSGKSLSALTYATQQIEKGKDFNKLICFVNPMASRNSARLGFYPGTRNEKLLDSSVGSMLAAKFGDRIALEEKINKGEILLLPFSDIRGFDTTGMKAIVYIIEAQNLDVDLMKLAIQRVGEDGKMIIDGDYTSQVDSPYYEGANNGMRRASEVFRGEDYYGEVELPIVYRSRMAAKADEM